MRSLTFAVAAVLAMVAVAFAAPNITSAALPFLSDPHTHAVAVLGAAAAIDPDAVRAELARIAGGVDEFRDKWDGKFGEFLNRLSDVEQKQIKLLRDPRYAGGGTSSSYSGAELRAALEGSSDLKHVADRRLRRAVIDLPPGSDLPGEFRTTCYLSMAPW